MSNEARIAELEARLAFQDQLCAQLDEVVREFAERVESLELQVRELKQSTGALPVGPAHDPPPHY